MLVNGTVCIAAKGFWIWTSKLQAKPNMSHAFSWPPNITIFYPLPLPTFSRIKYTNVSTQCENSVKIERGIDKLSVIRCVGEQFLQCVLCFTPLFSLLAIQLYKPAKQECSLNATPRKDRDKNSLTDPPSPFPFIIYPLCRSNQINEATKIFLSRFKYYKDNIVFFIYQTWNWLVSNVPVH